MNENFRRRVFTPIVMPLTILGVILVFALSLSRILLAVPESMSVLIAVVVAAYVMVVAFVVERAGSISAPAVGVALVVGMVALVGGGSVAASVGIREIEHHGEEGEGAGAEGGEAVAEIPDGAAVFETAGNLEYTAAPDSIPAGEATIAIDNPTGLPHNVAFEGVQNDGVIVEATGGVDVGTVSLEPGDYTYFCTVAGHRAAGMEGTVTVQ